MRSEIKDMYLRVLRDRLRIDGSFLDHHPPARFGPGHLPGERRVVLQPGTHGEPSLTFSSHPPSSTRRGASTVTERPLNSVPHCCVKFASGQAVGADLDRPPPPVVDGAAYKHVVAASPRGGLPPRYGE